MTGIKDDNTSFIRFLIHSFIQKLLSGIVYCLILFLKMAATFPILCVALQYNLATLSSRGGVCFSSPWILAGLWQFSSTILAEMILVTLRLGFKQSSTATFVAQNPANML